MKTKTEEKLVYEGNVFTGHWTHKATTRDDEGNSHTATNTNRGQAIKDSQDGLANQKKK